MKLIPHTPVTEAIWIKGRKRYCVVPMRPHGYPRTPEDLR